MTDCAICGRMNGDGVPHECDRPARQEENALYFVWELEERAATGLINQIKRLNLVIPECQTEVKETAKQLEQKRARLSQLVAVQNTWLKRAEQLPRTGLLDEKYRAESQAKTMNREIRHLKQDSVSLRYRRDEAERVVSHGIRQKTRLIGELHELARRPFGDGF